jgi:AcrR family transcriptional regulator
MMPDKAKHKENIIIAASECLEKKGIQAVTVRDIAREAGVNVAAVNYYFGSKDILMEECLKYSLYSTLTRHYKEIEKSNPEPRSLLKAFFRSIFQGASQWPNILKAHIYGPVMDNNYQGIFVEWLNDIAGRLAVKIAEVDGAIKDVKRLKMVIMQMLSVVLLWSLMPGLFDKFSGFDFKESQKQDQYLDLLLESYLGPVDKK